MYILPYTSGTPRFAGIVTDPVLSLHTVIRTIARCNSYNYKPYRNYLNKRTGCDEVEISVERGIVKLRRKSEIP